MDPRNAPPLSAPRRTSPALACVLLVMLALAVILLGEAAHAGASSTPPPAATAATPTPSEPEPEAEAEETEEAAEWAEWGTEEGEEEGGSEAHLPPGVPAACQEYAVTARVVTSIPHGTIHLSVAYDSYEAGRAKLAFWLKGARGSLKLGSATWKISERGHLSRTAHVDRDELAKVSAARVFVVHVEMPGTPGSCERYCTRHLSSRHRSDGRTIWFEPTHPVDLPLRRMAAHR